MGGGACFLFDSRGGGSKNYCVILWGDVKKMLI